MHVTVVIVGAGIAGVAAANSLARRGLSCLLVDERPPMSFTSAQSGDNYRNWWPHPTMVQFSEQSISLMHQLQQRSEHAFAMSSRGYLLATRRRDISALVEDLRSSMGDDAYERDVRFHDSEAMQSHGVPSAQDAEPPAGIDIVCGRKLVASRFAYLNDNIEHVLHIRKAGDINSQEMARFLLAEFKTRGGCQLRGRVQGMEPGRPIQVAVSTDEDIQIVTADMVVNAAGPHLNEVGAMLGYQLPVHNVYQQKVAFKDTHGLVARSMPFAIDLDPGYLCFDDDERAALAEDDELRWVTEKLPGGTHIRPEGGDRSQWLKVGWAYNTQPSDQVAPEVDPHKDPLFPELVIRGVQRLMSPLGSYLAHLPSGWLHYGGYYTMTRENWPLIGATPTPGTFVVGALSGFGTMAACAAGELVAGWVCEESLPAYATHLSLARYDDDRLMADITRGTNRGIL